MEKTYKYQEDRLQTRITKYHAGQSNKGGAAYNVINLDYDQSKEGKVLRQFDDDAKVRALIRSKNLDNRANCGYNILTGANRMQVQIPANEKYNPISHTAQQVIQRTPSNRSQLPPSAHS